MKLVCPGCGAISSAEAWVNDANCRETLFIITNLPSPLPKVTMGYLSLFRPGKQALTWKKALRLAGEVGKLTAKGYVSVRGQVDRNCSAGIWAQGMEQMIEQRNRLNLPMPNHRYLEKVAYDLADRADSRQEKQKRKEPLHKQRKPAGHDADPGLDPLEKARREWDKKHGNDEINNGLKGLSTAVKGMK